MTTGDEVSIDHDGFLQDGAASIIAPLGPDGDVGVLMNIETSPDNW